MRGASQPGAPTSAVRDGSAAARAELRLEASARFWLRAYPRRWRAARGTELLGLVLDLETPGARRLRARTALDLLRGGWATRWREHPPLHTWLGYRMLRRTIPVPYRAWAADDIDGFWYPARSALFQLWVLAPQLFIGYWHEHLVLAGGVILAAITVSVLVWPEPERRRARLKHLAPADREPRSEGTLVTVEVPGVRIAARPALTSVVLLAGTAAVASLVVVAAAPNALRLGRDAVDPTGEARRSWHLVLDPVADRGLVLLVLAAALALGLVAALVARRRLGRLLGELAPQPHRLLRPLRGTDRTSVAFCCLIIVGLGAVELSGRYPLELAVLVGAPALVLAPGALVALAAVRALEVSAPAGRDISAPAGRDVWWIAAHGRAPAVERPVPALRPLEGPAARPVERLVVPWGQDGALR